MTIISVESYLLANFKLLAMEKYAFCTHNGEITYTIRGYLDHGNQPNSDSMSTVLVVK